MFLFTWAYQIACLPVARVAVVTFARVRAVRVGALRVDVTLVGPERALVLIY